VLELDHFEDGADAGLRHRGNLKGLTLRAQRKT
jgi:hypothetical protein